MKILICISQNFSPLDSASLAHFVKETGNKVSVNDVAFDATALSQDAVIIDGTWGKADNAVFPLRLGIEIQDAKDVGIKNIFVLTSESDKKTRVYRYIIKDDYALLEQVGEDVFEAKYEYPSGKKMEIPTKLEPRIVALKLERGEIQDGLDWPTILNRVMESVRTK